MAKSLVNNSGVYFGVCLAGDSVKYNIDGINHRNIYFTPDGISYREIYRDNSITDGISKIIGTDNILVARCNNGDILTFNL